ncbi:MAG TPA: hypothetical protein DCW90_03575 [Lachnospiraceae bacterium]|nr:hypothetical protein [Lachnospiraceae bacterium]
MTKAELRKELEAGVKLEDIFEFTNGQDCLIYKGNFNTLCTRENPKNLDIIYIPDIYLNNIPIDRSVNKDEIDGIIHCCYTSSDFIFECGGHSILAEDLFNFVDWQHPDIQDFLDGYDDKEQFFKEYGFPMDDLFVTNEMKNLLSKIADLASQASDEVYDDDDEKGTAGILSLCDQLCDKIDKYLEGDEND